MFYKIDAIDTLFFRNASPFDAELSQSAISLFPPFPSVYAGALRYADTSDHPDKTVISRKLKIGFNGIMVDGRIMLPRPLDTIVLPTNEIQIMPLITAPIGSYSLPFVLSGEGLGKGKEPELKGGGYLDEGGINQYLQSNPGNIPCTPLARLIDRERHVGIQIDSATGATQAGLWYAIEKVRPISLNQKKQGSLQEQKCSLVVEADGIAITTPSVIRLGGEAKAASINVLGTTPAIRTISSTKKYFKLYLATPSIFKHGWIPWWIDPDSKEGVFAYKKRRIRVRLISAAVGRHIAIGGFAFEQRKPKEMRYAVPAGSVYFFEILEGEFDDAVKLFHQKCISDYREGYGFVYENWNRMRYCDRGLGYSLIGAIGANQGGHMDV